MKDKEKELKYLIYIKSLEIKKLKKEIKLLSLELKSLEGQKALIRKKSE